MRSTAAAVRIGVSALLLLVACLEALRLMAALAGAVGAYAVATHAALAALAALAGAGLWLQARWAPPAILALGCVFAATRLVDALVLGVRPWLFALLAAVAALGSALLLAAWAKAGARPLS